MSIINPIITLIICQICFGGLFMNKDVLLIILLIVNLLLWIFLPFWYKDDSNAD